MKGKSPLFSIMPRKCQSLFRRLRAWSLLEKLKIWGYFGHQDLPSLPHSSFWNHCGRIVMAGRDLMRSQAQLPLKVLTNVEFRPDAQGYVQLHLENLQGFSGLSKAPLGLCTSV